MSVKVQTDLTQRPGVDEFGGIDPHASNSVVVIGVEADWIVYL